MLGGNSNGESLLNGYRVSAWDDEQFQETDGGDDCITL